MAQDAVQDNLQDVDLASVVQDAGNDGAQESGLVQESTEQNAVEHRANFNLRSLDS